MCRQFLSKLALSQADLFSLLAIAILLVHKVFSDSAIQVWVGSLSSLLCLSCRRTFGEGTNFEVSRTAEGVQQTLCPIGSRFYDFYLSPTGLLLVQELPADRDQSCMFELLDVGAGCTCGPWGSELPVRLRELHSHWVCR